MDADREMYPVYTLLIVCLQVILYKNYDKQHLMGLILYVVASEIIVKQFSLFALLDNVNHMLIKECRSLEMLYND